MYIPTTRYSKLQTYREHIQIHTNNKRIIYTLVYVTTHTRKNFGSYHTRKL